MARYLFEQEELTCVTLEQELGLNRGDIVSITTYPDGAVEIETRISLAPPVEANLSKSLAKRGLPRGKKP